MSAPAEHFFCCKGTLTAGGPCPEIVSSMGHATGAPPTVQLKSDSGPVVAAVIEDGEYQLTCARKHTFYYKVGVDQELAKTGLTPSRAQLTVEKPRIDRDYWLDQGYLMVNEVYTRVNAQVKNVDGLLKWLMPLIPVASGAGALFSRSTALWPYLLLLLPNLLVLLGQAFCTWAQLPGAFTFEPSNWDQCRKAQEHFVGIIVSRLRVAQVLAMAAVIATAVAMIMLAYAQRSGSDPAAG